MSKRLLISVVVLAALLMTSMLFAQEEKRQLAILLPAVEGQTSEAIPVTKAQLEMYKAGKVSLDDLRLNKATGIVDTLESKDLVMRQPNPADRRSLLVTLTESGQSLRESTPTVDRIFRGCCTGLEPAEAHELSRLLKKLSDSLE